MGNNPWDKESGVTSYGNLQLGRSSKISVHVPERPAPEGEGWRNSGFETSQEMGVLTRRSCRLFARESEGRSRRGETVFG